MKPLYDFQKKALDSLAGYENVLLAWQMGTGKTYGAIEQAKRYQSPVWVCLVPKSTVNQWTEAIREQAPDYRVFNAYKHSRCDGTRTFLVTAGQKALIIGYDTFKAASSGKLRDYLSRNGQAVTMICDESSLLGEMKSARTRSVLGTKTAHKILLSGTPASGGKLEKLIPTARILGWPISKEGFLNEYCEVKQLPFIPTRSGRPVSIITGYRNIPELRENLCHYGTSFLTLEDAGIELPEVREMMLTTDAPKEYRKFLKDRIVSVSSPVREDSGSHPSGSVRLVGDSVLTKFLYSRQLCAPYNPSRLSAVEELLEASSGERVIIFYTWNDELSILQQLCERLGRPCSLVNGKTLDLKAYQNEADSVTLCQYEAGSTGLNLQNARIAIFYSPTLSCSTHEQAVARIHRIGQEKPAVVYNLICRDTVEARIYDHLLQGKSYSQELFERDFEKASLMERRKSR